MTTGAFILLIVFGFGVGLFALLAFHLEDDSKKSTKHKHVIHKH
jgi:hypothetical protein